MKRLLIALYVVINLLTVSLAVPLTVHAAVPSNCDTSKSLLGLPTWYMYLDIGPKEIKGSDGSTISKDPCAITLPQKDGNTDWGLAAGRIGLAVVEILLRLASIVAVIFVFYGGISFVISEGNPDKTAKAKNTVFNAIIGLIITIIASAGVNFIGGTLIN